MPRSASVALSAVCGNSWARNAKLAEIFIAAITVPLEFSPEGMGLERGEEGVEFGEMGAVNVLLPFNRCDNVDERLLHLYVRNHNEHLHEVRLIYSRNS